MFHFDGGGLAKPIDCIKIRRPERTEQVVVELLEWTLTDEGVENVARECTGGKRERINQNR